MRSAGDGPHDGQALGGDAVPVPPEELGDIGLHICIMCNLRQRVKPTDRQIAQASSLSTAIALISMRYSGEVILEISTIVDAVCTAKEENPSVF